MSNDAVKAKALTFAEISKIVDEIAKTEGAQAADAALQRMTREYREARAAEAPADIDDFDLGDLDASSGEAPEVIEHLYELEADPEDRARGRLEARLAALRAECTAAETKASVAQESVLTSGTDVPKTANRAAQAVAAAENTERGAPADRALREHEAPAPESAPPNTNEVTAAEEAAITKAEIEHLLGDLEVGAGEAGGEVIEPLGELDAAAEDAVEGAIAKAEAYEDRPAGVTSINEARKAPNKVQEHIRAYRAKDERRKVANKLKKFGLTLADLPGDFWDLPRFSKHGDERSRQNELHRVCDEAEQLRKLETRGLPANYWLLPRFERDRIGVNARQRRCRDKKRKPSSKPTVPPLPIAHVAPERLEDTVADMLQSLEKWAAAGSTRQLRKAAQHKLLIEAVVAYARHFNRHGKQPSLTKLAEDLGCSKDQARRRLDVLERLYAPGGPWTEGVTGRATAEP